MEGEFELTIDVEIEYEVGSPPDGDIDHAVLAQPVVLRWSSIWMVRPGGSSEGVLTSDTTAVYPPFTDDERRQVFCLLDFATLGSAGVTWNGESFKPGRIFLTTDSGWPTPAVTVSGTLEGSWFAVEGELEDDYRQWREGDSSNVTL